MAGGGAPTGAIRAAGATLSKFQEVYSFGLILSLFFLWGFSYSLVDVLNKKVQNSFGITTTESTAIQACYFGAYFVCSIPASWSATRFGYRITILGGLVLYIIGSLLFWPAAHYAVYWPFPVCAFVTASGLCTLEVMANAYMSVLGSPEKAAFRLNLGLAFNGLAGVIGPQIASHTFLKDDSEDLDQLQWTYVGVAGLGALLFVLFIFSKLPEITEDDNEEAQEEFGVVDDRPLWKRKHTVLGFVTQFCYVGAQCSVAGLTLNYLTDKGAYSTPRATQLFSYLQVTYMLCRFIGAVAVCYIPATLVLLAHALVCSAFSLMASFTSGQTGLVALFFVFGGESILYVTIFTLAVQNNGKRTKRSSGLLCMGVGGGAVMPSIQATVADARSIELSWLVPGTLGYMPIVAYAVGMHVYNRRWAARRAAAAGQGVEAALPSPTEMYEDKAAAEKLDRA
ncbi:hypothetical protein JCM8097_002039 [Rhodosporidiobolus ruineniae]